nr:DNA-directed DNA polymerase [Tanacetum cinerariifolium]
MKRLPEECYDLIENMTAQHNDWDTSLQRSESSISITSFSDLKIIALKAEMAEINKNLMKVLQINQQVKEVTHNCETCGGPHSYNDCPAIVGQTQNNMFGQFMKMNTASSLGSGTLLSMTITNPKEDLKGSTTRSGNAYQGPTIPTTSSPPKVVECETKVTKDTVPPTNNGRTKDVQPLVVQVETPISNSEPVIAPVVEPVVAPVSAPKPKPKPSIPYPFRLHDQKLRDKDIDQREKFFQMLQDLDFNISFADALILMPNLGRSRCKHKSHAMRNKISLQELFPTCMTLELADRLISRPVGVAEDVFVKVGTFHFSADFVVVDFDANPQVPLILGRSFLKTRRALIDIYKGELTLPCEEYSQEVLGFSVSGNPTPSMEPIVSNSSPTLTPFMDKGDILILEEFLNDDPSSPPLPPQELKVVEPTNEKSSIDEPPVVKLQDLPPHLEYAFLEGDDKFPIIIAKDLKDEEKTALIKVLKSHKQALAWINLKIHEVIKKEVLKLLDAGLIYPISDSHWVSPVHCVPKKGGFTVVENEENKLIPTQLVTGWRVCIDYRKLNDATRKDHFPLPFMDQMLERLAGNEYYCFLDGFSGYFQILIDPQDQEKTTFAYPYGMFSYRRMPFGLCNALGTFQRCMMAVFHDMIEKTMEVFMDDFSEKSHFMVKEGIVLGHKISKNVIEVDKAKVDIIAKLPHPTTVKENDTLAIRVKLDFDPRVEIYGMESMIDQMAKIIGVGFLLQKKHALKG